MREIVGRLAPAHGRTVHVEESGQGDDWVVFEAGAGCGRTCWDRVRPLVADSARVVAYDRAGRGLSGPAGQRQSVDDMAADLVAMTETVVPGSFLLVAHSMGGLIARRAVGQLGPRLRGLLLVDPTPETSPVYDTWDQSIRKVDRALAVSQALTRVRPLARLFSGNVRRLFPAQTYEAMLAEDFSPIGISQTRKEMRAVAAAIPAFRAQPPAPPTCPTVVLSATRPARGREKQNASLNQHQRRYADSLSHGRYRAVDSAHFVQAEQPLLLATEIRELLQVTA